MIFEVPFRNSVKKGKMSDPIEIAETLRMAFATMAGLLIAIGTFYVIYRIVAKIEDDRWDKYGDE